MSDLEKAAISMGYRRLEPSKPVLLKPLARLVLSIHLEYKLLESWGKGVNGQQFCYNRTKLMDKDYLEQIKNFEFDVDPSHFIYETSFEFITQKEQFESLL